MRRFFTPVLAMVAGAMMAVPAGAATIYFSSESSDSTPPEVLNAHIDWSFDEGTNQLTLDIFNDTFDPAYTISTLQFNTSNDVTGFSVASHTRYDSGGNVVNPSNFNVTIGGGNGAGGFGTFDWSMDFGNGQHIGPTAGERLTVVLNVTGSSLDASDFFNPPAVQGQTETGVAVMHFQRGPNDDSAWGIPGNPPDEVIPEPATVVLLGLGVAGLAARRFRSNKS